MHPRTNRRNWQPINTRPHSSSPRPAAKPVSPRPARIFAAPRAAFPKPCTQPPTPCLSNRYSGKIEFHVSYRKHSPLTFANRYSHGGSLAAEFPLNLHSPLAFSFKINRNLSAAARNAGLSKPSTQPPTLYPSSHIPLPPFSPYNRINASHKPEHAVSFQEPAR
jgi:hypothetical protein